MFVCARPTSVCDLMEFGYNEQSRQTHCNLSPALAKTHKKRIVAFASLELSGCGSLPPASVDVPSLGLRSHGPRKLVVTRTAAAITAGADENLQA